MVCGVVWCGFTNNLHINIESGSCFVVSILVEHSSSSAHVYQEMKHEKRTCSNATLVKEKTSDPKTVPPLPARPARPVTRPPPTKADIAVEANTMGLISYQEGT